MLSVVLVPILGVPVLAAQRPVVATPAVGGEGLSLLEVVTLMLEHDPNVALAESSRAAARGSLLVASGRFDPRMTTDLATSDDRLPVAGGGLDEAESVDATWGVDSELRTGMILSPRVSIRRDELLGPGAVDRATVSFTVRQPLLRDRGRRAVAADERAAERELSAAELDLEHTVAERIRAVVDSYWRFKAAAENLTILETSEDRSRELLETTRRLIEADRVPAAEILQLQADVAAKESGRIRAEQELFAARQELGREIGLPYRQTRNLPLPEDGFPDLAPAAAPDVEQAPEFLALAHERRSDVSAARQRLEASAFRTRAADNALLPRLDLLVTPGYSGLSEEGGAGGFVSSLLDDVPGLSTSVSVALSWPTLNRQARGGFLRARAVEEQSEYLLALLRNDLEASVPTALDSLARSSLELERAIESVRLFERAVTNEEKKLRAGTSTLIDVISQQDRLTLSRQSVVAAQLGVALALLDLRFETGTLLAGGEPDYAVDGQALTTVPDLEEAIR